MKRFSVLLSLLFLASAAFADPTLKALENDKVIKAMSGELKRSMKKLSKTDPPIYFLSYQINDEKYVQVSSSLGETSEIYSRNTAAADVDARAGSRELDNTRRIKSVDYSGRDYDNISIESDFIPFPNQIKNTLWLLTEKAATSAQEKFLKAKTNIKTAAQRTDNSNDFSAPMKPNYYYAPIENTPLLNPETIQKITADLNEFSAMFKNKDFILSSNARYSAELNNSYFVNSEGTKIVQGRILARISYYITSRNKDGMTLERGQSYDFTTLDEIPSNEKIKKDILQSIEELRQLQNAPAAEPFHGPVILKNRATGVFFHEILGHRVEGHRQKDDDFGQTFTNKIGQEVISPLISVSDNPTLKYFGSIPLRGYYAYDDEGVQSSDVSIIKDGVLKNFLMSRSPINNFPVSNGHGRKDSRHRAVSRMGVTIVEAARTVDFPTLKEMLKEEIKKQNKPYGLIIDDISGGFTMINTSSPQSFKVQPLLVYRVYADGRPDEIIRGADIVGTPLTSFNKIIAAADDYSVFNGSCGAESGWVPVSAIAPSVLISELEVEKVEKSYDNLPILTPPNTKQEKGGKK